MMRKHRCGPLQGFTSWRWFSHWHIRFHRVNRWAAWRVVDVMESTLCPPDHRGFADELQEILVHKISQDRVKKLDQHLVDEKGREKFPHLVSFLSDAFFISDAGADNREPGTIYIAPRGGVLNVWLKEPSQGLAMHVGVKSIVALLATLEAALGNEGSMWEKDRYASARRKKKT